MTGTGYVATFIGHEPGKALFVGLYSIGTSRPLSYEEFCQFPAFIEMRGLGGFSDEDSLASTVWFDLALMDFYDSWKGKLIVRWPPPELSWWRRANRNEIPILAILEDGALDAAMPKWDEVCLTWKELSVLPTRWKSILSQ